jgi:hypothetical protein
MMLATLQELERLARERSSEKRRALLHAIRRLSTPRPKSRRMTTSS